MYYNRITKRILRSLLQILAPLFSPRTRFGLIIATYGNPANDEVKKSFSITICAVIMSVTFWRLGVPTRMTFTFIFFHETISLESSFDRCTASADTVDWFIV